MEKSFVAYKSTNNKIYLIDRDLNWYSSEMQESNGLSPLIRMSLRMNACICSTSEPGIFHLSIPVDRLSLLKRIPKPPNAIELDVLSVINDDHSLENQLYIKGAEVLAIPPEIVVSFHGSPKTKIMEMNGPIDPQTIQKIINMNKVVTLDILSPGSIDLGLAKTAASRTDRPNWWKNFINFPTQNRTDDVLAKKINLAIIDSGIEIDHIAFKSSFNGLVSSNIVNRRILGNLCQSGLLGFNFRGQKPCPDSDHTHGTMMTGVIAADWDQTESVMPGIPFYTFQIHNDNGFKPVELYLAIESALQKGAKIISVSGFINWNNKGFDKVMRRVKNQDAIIVTAAGNKIGNIDTIDYGFERYKNNMVSVTGLKLNSDELLDNANYGKAITIAAPGDLLGSVTRGVRGIANAGDTSGATALTAGVLAYLWSIPSPKRTARQLINSLRELGDSRRTAKKAGKDTGIPILDLSFIK